MRFWKYIPVLVLSVAVGCSNDGKKPETQKEKAHNSWNSARAGVLYSLAKQQYESGNYDACRKSVDEGIARDPKSVALRILSTRLAIEQGQLQVAQKEAEEARKLDPKEPEADYLMGVVQQRWQQPEAALVSYSAAVEKKPNELAYLMAKAEMLVALDRRDEALAMLKEKLVFHENVAAIRDAVGQLLVQQGKHAEAVKVLRQATILAPDEMHIREHLGLALYYAKDYHEASIVIERLVKNERFSQRADLLTALGECQLQTDRAREARESFESASQLDPASARVWLNLAKASLQIGDLPRAELSIRKASTIEPKKSEISLIMGYLRLKQNRMEESLAAFVKAATLDPNDTTSLCMCGYVLEKQGRKAEAMKYYGRALKIKPTDEMAAQLMANVGFDE